MLEEDKKIKEILVKEGYVDPKTAEDAEASVKSGKFDSIVQYLFEKEIINKDILGQAIAESLKVPYADLNSQIPSKEQVLRLPEELARKYNAVIFSEDAKNIIIATTYPKPEILPELKAFFDSQNIKKNIKLAYSLKEDIDSALLNYRQKLEARFIDILKRERRVAPEIISEIFEDAVLYRVSDVHFEPQEKDVVVRFRIDGVLQEVGHIPKEIYENILNRIKVQARLRIDDHFSAQDGSLRYSSPSIGTVDARISIMPTLEGEKIVIRVLSQYMRSFKLGDLGLSDEKQKELLRAASKPFGMILVTGPTGSGKTTTLYALLKILNDSEINITTIEDPVEYRIAGVNQVQVNLQTNLTFANGVRSIVRQDPDVIMVGEIRDRETVEIAVNAALTGHLLLSTFHANDAATAIPRLLDMGAEPFLMASTLELIIAQRLVRRICETCRYSVPLSKANLQVPDEVYKYLPPEATLYRGKGCNVCNLTGYRGRTAIFEFINITSKMQDLILKNPSTSQILSLARSQGSRSLFEDGVSKALAGITTLEELSRVAPPPDISLNK